uniref:Dynein light chain roadblock-type 2 n=1 Tax=Crocodylus porosus TaxID=8502 RepID=A0A7M4EDA5_CROPO
GVEGRGPSTAPASCFPPGGGGGDAEEDPGAQGGHRHHRGQCGRGPCKTAGVCKLPLQTIRSRIPIRTTLDNSTTVQYAGLLHQLTMKARSTVRDIDPQNDLTFLRIRSKKHEIMVAPDKEYLLIVIQNPCE